MVQKNVSVWNVCMRMDAPFICAGVLSSCKAVPGFDWLNLWLPLPRPTYDPIINTDSHTSNLTKPLCFSCFLIFFFFLEFCAWFSALAIKNFIPLCNYFNQNINLDAPIVIISPKPFTQSTHFISYNSPSFHFLKIVNILTKDICFFFSLTNKFFFKKD